MVTETEFLARMVGKGRTAAWAQEEWERRRADPHFENGVCEDTNLPTVAVRMNPKREEYTDEGMGETFDVGEKEIKAPKQQDIDGALRHMMERAPVPGKLAQAARSGDLVGAMAGLTSALAASSSGGASRSDLDFQQFVEEKGGGVQPQRTPEKDRSKQPRGAVEVASTVDDSDKKKKMFSQDDEVPKYQARVRKSISLKESALNKALTQAKETLSAVPAKGGDTWDRYADFATLLEVRVACGEALLQNDKSAWSDWSADRVAKYNKGLAEKSLALCDRLPCTTEVLSGLSPVPVVQAEVSSMFMKCDGFDTCDLEVYDFENTWGSHMTTFLALLKKATTNVQSVTRAITSEASRNSKAAAQSSLQAGKLQALAAAQQQAGQASQPPAADAYKVFSLDWASVASVSQEGDSSGGFPRHLPALTDVAAMCEEAPCSLSLGVFKSACRKEFATAPGTRKLNELTNADAVRERMLGMLKISPTDRVLDDMPDLRRVTVFGLGPQVQHVGVEPFAVAGVRAYASGSARLGTVSFLSAQEFVAKQSPELKNISLAKVLWVGVGRLCSKNLTVRICTLLRLPVSSACGLGGFAFTWSPLRRRGSREEAHLSDPRSISDRPHPGVAQAGRTYTDAR